MSAVIDSHAAVSLDLLALFILTRFSILLYFIFGVLFLVPLTKHCVGGVERALGGLVAASQAAGYSSLLLKGKMSVFQGHYF